MNGHQNVMFSHLIGALKSPRNLNGYGADYAINWELISLRIDEETLTESILETFKDKWNWHKLSSNERLSLSYDLLDKYADFWDWEEIINRYRNNVIEGQAIEFYERYKEHIPAAKVQNSRLWHEIVDQQKRQLIAEITA